MPPRIEQSFCTVVRQWSGTCALLTECVLRLRVATLKIYRKFINRNVSKCFCLFLFFYYLIDSIDTKILNPANLTYDPVTFIVGNYLSSSIYSTGIIS
jgi:hypothetical protein